jgi:hypothetical protein
MLHSSIGGNLCITFARCKQSNALLTSRAAISAAARCCACTVPHITRCTKHLQCCCRIPSTCCYHAKGIHCSASSQLSLTAAQLGCSKAAPRRWHSASTIRQCHRQPNARLTSRAAISAAAKCCAWMSLMLRPRSVAAVATSLLAAFKRL